MSEEEIKPVHKLSQSLLQPHIRGGNWHQRDAYNPFTVPPTPSPVAGVLLPLRSHERKPEQILSCVLSAGAAG